MTDNGVIKMNGNEDFTICQNDIIRHVGEGGMSAKALGVYMVIKYYISIPNFAIHKDHIQRVSGEGKKAFETVWKELKELGYIVQERKKASDGKWKYEYTLHRSRKEVDGKIKAPTFGEAEDNTNKNSIDNISICNNDNNNTSRTKNKVENVDNKLTEVEKAIKESNVNIKKTDLKECNEKFNDIDVLVKALGIMECNNSHGIKALRSAYKQVLGLTTSSKKDYLNKCSSVIDGKKQTDYDVEEFNKMVYERQSRANKNSISKDYKPIFVNTPKLEGTTFK